jgi:Receptor L domain
MTNMTNAKYLVLAAGLSMACSTSHREVTAPSASRTICEGGRATNTVELERFAHCTDIRGNLKVGGVSTLAPLATLHSVSGSLTIENTRELGSLEGLEQLESVKGLVLIANADLEDISALSALQSVSTIDIVGNPELSNLSGLVNVQKLERLRLDANGIHSTVGLEQLTEIGDLSISNNQALISVGAMNGVAKIGRMVVERNPRLAGYYGLFNGVQTKPAMAKFSDNVGLSAAEQARFEAQVPATHIASR